MNTRTMTYMEVREEVINQHNRLHELGWEWFKTEPPNTHYGKALVPLNRNAVVSLEWPPKWWWDKQNHPNGTDNIAWLREYNAGVLARIKTEAATEDLKEFCV